ncbi:nitrile hydratase subunit beta [Aquibaculum arenosum]|uniref:Nitrile hydratase subunit beta n=1 Tax=Aquibaculum arenosum TaxID=3032591 RepID=A0ABT5YNX3_9PROT|nr:nitrile hydratase subunit beta [Fodinicurvata sp. CAU 1616]MDF2096528.1 nitrile hydratase subunit beta [Fodinicurvata sp. CAU 1616]
MNGVHDMGGMHGFGALPLEENEPVFHGEWEERALALTLAMAAWGKWNIDASRHAREKLPPADYLRYSYYERWIEALANMMVEHGLVSAEELRQGQPAAGSSKAQPPLDATKALAALRRGGPADRAVDQAPRFAIGQSVRAINHHPAGHTRLPRYARGKRGEIVMHHGAHVFADSNAHFLGEAPQHLYAVRFSARELWGPQGRPQDCVTLDLWEPHLEAA